MDESCPHPNAAAPAAAAADPETHRRLEPWRRFHFGDRVAGLPPVPPRTLPAALHALRGLTVRGGWPLLVDPDAETESFARPFADWLGAQPMAEKSLADNRGRIELRLVRSLANGSPRAARELLAAAAAGALEELDLGAEERGRFREAAKALADALPKGALLLPFGPTAPIRLVDLAARRRVRRARRRFAAQTSELATAIAALLDSDRERRPGGRPAEEQVGKLGVLGSRFVDPSRLSGVVAHRRQGEPLSEERRARLERAQELLAAVESDPTECLWIVPAGAGSAGLDGARPAEDPCEAAAALFDERAAATLETIRAARLARLEVAGVYDAERHAAGLERLDWRGLGADELALVTPLVAVVRAADARGRGLASLVALLQSGRPVQVLLLDGADGEAADAGAVRFDPAYLGVGLREVFVHQGSPARPANLARGFERALAGSRPALHVVDAPTFAAVDLDPWLVGSARISGRAAPLFRYEPEAGASWARRVRFDDNPETDTDWPSEPVPEGLKADGLPGTLPFTYADAALLDPGWREHFAPVEGGGDDLVPLDLWLTQAPEEAARTLPFVWGASAEGVALRFVVTRALAFATRDRLGLWRTLAELAGVRNEHVEEAVARTRREADERAARERDDLAARHAAELEQARAEADAAAVDHLIASLFEVEPTLGRAPAGIPARRAEAPAAAPAAESAPGGGETPTAAAAAPEAAAVAAPAQEDAWVDTALCTSCDECIRKFPSIFAYNSDKQAYITNPRAGSFRDLVVAAEACTAKVIHPGTPWNPAEPGLEDLVPRAQVFA